MKDYLFIAGCPRSGTSALGQLVSGSEDIVMGMERFGHLCLPRKFSLTPDHFKKDRFFTVHNGDTFYSSFDKFHAFDKDIHTKFNSAKIIGDKRPELYLVYDELFSTFENIKMFFIYRNIEEVASSYKGRIAEGKFWPKSRNFSSAVRDWNKSIYLTSEAIKKGHSIACVNYDDVFMTNNPLKPLFDYIGVEMSDELNKKIKNIRARAKQLSKVRKSLLTSDEKGYIATNAKAFLLKRIAPYDILS